MRFATLHILLTSKSDALRKIQAHKVTSDVMFRPAFSLILGQTVTGVTFKRPLAGLQLGLPGGGEMQRMQASGTCGHKWDRVPADSASELEKAPQRMHGVAPALPTTGLPASGNALNEARDMPVSLG